MLNGAVAGRGVWGFGKLGIGRLRRAACRVFVSVRRTGWVGSGAPRRPLALGGWRWGARLLDLLAVDRKPFWHYRRYGVEALLSMGKKSEALQYAEASRGLNQPDSVIDQACEEILISSGLYDEAYRRYGLRVAQGNSYLARFRAVAKRYPMKDASAILADLIAMTPGEEGKWFATAKELELYELALDLANRSPCDPKTLARAARDNLDSASEFALGSALAALRWLSEGWGYEVTSVDVMEAYDRAMDATARLNRADDVSGQIRQLVEANDNGARQFVRQALQEKMRVGGDDDGPVT